MEWSTLKSLIFIGFVRSDTEARCHSSGLARETEARKVSQSWPS